MQTCEYCIVPDYPLVLDITKGGEGSGHFGHEGRPGEVGGSNGGGGAAGYSFNFVGNPPYASNQQEYSVTDSKGKSVGRFVIGKDFRKKEIHIYEAYVKPEARGQSIGKKFLREQAFKSPGMKFFVAHAEPDAVGYWKHIGFKITGKSGNTTYMTMATSQTALYKTKHFVKFLVENEKDSNNEQS